MIPFITSHWVHIVAISTTLWAVTREVFNRVANALPAPTKDSTPDQIWWFQFVNGMAGNTERAKNTSIENSPNFIPAAEAYMAKKLAEQQGAGITRKN